MAWTMETLSYIQLLTSAVYGSTDRILVRARWAERDEVTGLSARDYQGCNAWQEASYIPRQRERATIACY